ncbi:MAG TPA: type II toxin-antitoxin system PemK/MazF family toxin [Bdellovibrionota bacterium]|nr:type II toxin-antitoxin system PemK/MazF family toxin [Bdellovibrionota bacterium]
MNNSPQRWHIYVIDLEPRIGTKPGKQRPCVVVQPSEFGEGELQSTVVLPLTTKITTGNAYPLRVRIPQGTCNLTKTSEAMIDQILAWDNELFREDLGILPEGIQEEIKTALLEFLDLL